MNPTAVGVRRITLFAAINHLARMSDPRVSEPPPESLQAISDAVGLAAKSDPEFAKELADWVQVTATLVARVRSGQ